MGEVPIARLVAEYREQLEVMAQHGTEPRIAQLLSVLRFFTEWVEPYAHHGVGNEDLVQEAWLAIMEALRNYRANAGSLAGYARRYVQRALNDYINANQAVVRVASTVAQRKVLNNLRRLAPMWDRMSSADATRIARHLGVHTDDVWHVVRVLSAERRAIGVDGEDPPQTAERSDPAVAVALDDLHARRQAFLLDALERLSDRESAIIRQRFLSAHPRNRSVVARAVGVCAERIRQIENAVLEALAFEARAAGLAA